MARKELTQNNGAQASSKKLQTRDLIYADAFGAIYLVLMLVSVGLNQPQMVGLNQPIRVR